MNIKTEVDTADDESMTDERPLQVDSEEEAPAVSVKREAEESDDDDEDVPIFARVKKMKHSSDTEEETYKPAKVCLLFLCGSWSNAFSLVEEEAEAQ